MRFVLVFHDSGAAEAAWESMSGRERDEVSDRLDRWFTSHADRIRRNCQLKSVVTATTLRRSADGSVRLVDGPYGSEHTAVAGYVEIEVVHKEEAIAMARDWPLDTLIEIRAIS